MQSREPGFHQCELGFHNSPPRRERRSPTYSHMLTSLTMAEEIADALQYWRHLDQQGLAAVVIATAGYRIASDPYAALKKVRFPKEQVLVEL
jgi:hypothetical protein